MTKKKPRFGALPTLNMPAKSHETTKPTPRPGRSVVKDCEQPSSRSVCYKTFIELCQRVKGLKSFNDWNHKLFADRLVLMRVKNIWCIIIEHILFMTYQFIPAFLSEVYYKIPGMLACVRFRINIFVQ